MKTDLHQATAGFWRVHKDRDPELRHTVLTQVAFRDLQQLIDACGGDEDRAIRIFTGHTSPDEAADTERITAGVPHIDPTDGWMLPERLRLADYDLGHDDRAQEPQPVADRLGPRFYDWQLQQDPEESWEECQRHAELLEQIVPTTQAEPEPSPEDEETPETQGELL